MAVWPILRLNRRSGSGRNGVEEQTIAAYLAMSAQADAVPRPFAVTGDLLKVEVLLGVVGIGQWQNEQGKYAEE